MRNKVIDLSKSGLEVFGFIPYEIAMFHIIWRDRRSCSRNIYNELKGKGYTEARPTIIVSLKRHTKRGLFIEEKESNMLRPRCWYSFHPNLEEKLRDVFAELRREFPE